MEYLSPGQIVVSLLSDLSIPMLQDSLGHKMTNALYENGIEINSKNLASALYEMHGINVLKDENLRKNIFINFQDKERIERLYPPYENESNDERSERMISDLTFAWGKNKNTEKYLQNIGITDIELTNQSINLQNETVAPDAQLHAYQNHLRKKILAFLENDKNKKALVHMPTGSGKTRTSLESVCDYLRGAQDIDITIVWLAHSQELCQQSLDSFMTLWSRLGTECVRVHGLWGGAKLPDGDFKGVNFVVLSFQTAYKMLVSNSNKSYSTSQKIAKSCKLMIVDEAHQSIAPTYKTAINGFSSYNTKILGLTATPGRHHIGGDEEETHRLSEFYENHKISICDSDGNEIDRPIEYLTSKGILSSVKKYQIHSDSNFELSKKEFDSMQEYMDIPNDVLRRLGEDSKRTNLIASQALKLATEDNLQTIIFAPSKENCIILSLLLKLQGCHAEAVTSDMTKNDRELAITKFKNGDINVITNFGILTTGFDAPNIGAVIIARPTLSVVLYSQMYGRGLRGPAMGGSHNCIVVDVIDNILNMPNSDLAFSFFDRIYKS